MILSGIIGFLDADLSHQLRERVEERLAYRPVLVGRGMFLEVGSQLLLACVHVDLKTIVQSVGPVAAYIGVQHACDEVPHASYHGVACRRSRKEISIETIERDIYSGSRKT